MRRRRPQWCAGVGPSAGCGIGIGQRRYANWDWRALLAPVPNATWAGCCGVGRWAGTSEATGTGPTPIFPSSIVLSSSSLFASKYTDLAPTRLPTGVGNVLDPTVRPLPLASAITGTGPTPSLPDPTGITCWRGDCQRALWWEMLCSRLAGSTAQSFPTAWSCCGTTSGCSWSSL